MLGKTESKRRRGQQRMRWLDSITHSMDMNLSKLQETVGRGFWQATGHTAPKKCRWLSNWTVRTNSTRSGEGGEEREKESERHPIFNEMIPDFQHAVTFLVLSSSEIYFQALYRPLIYPVSPNLPCLRQVHIPHIPQVHIPGLDEHSGLRGSTLTHWEDPHLRRVWACRPLPPFFQPLPPVMASVSNITLGTDRALVTRGNQLPLDRKWLSIIS